MLLPLYISCAFVGTLDLLDNLGKPTLTTAQAALKTIQMTMLVFGYLGVFITTYQFLTS
jgi:hypothetical protein